jgi:hypothetical protein
MDEVGGRGNDVVDRSAMAAEDEGRLGISDNEASGGEAVFAYLLLGKNSGHREPSTASRLLPVQASYALKANMGLKLK